MKSSNILILRLSLLLGFISLNNFSWCQVMNYINNGGFEAGQTEDAQDNIVTEISSNYLDNWERANANFSGCHSPDWWRKGALDGFNFSNPYLPTVDMESYYPFTPPYAWYYDEIMPYDNAMIGMSVYELIQQKFKSAELLSDISGHGFTQLTVRFKIRISNATNGFTEILKVFLAKNKTEYKLNNPSDCHLSPFEEFDCDPDYRQYEIGSVYPIISENELDIKYPRGQWWLVEKTFSIPADIDVYDWLVIDFNSASEDACLGSYFFIDDVELIAGCDDLCGRTDGLATPTVAHNIDFNHSLTISNISDVKTLDFTVLNSSLVDVYHASISCANGIDHDLYWDGTNSLGDPFDDQTFHFIIKTINDCGEQEFNGIFHKLSDYTGGNVTNFNTGCLNGINITPGECCVAQPDFYINNEVLVGPDPGWSNYIIINNIWACTAQPDFSDEVRVENGAKVLFRAGNQITLDEGFHTRPGAVFIAEIGNCDRPRQFIGGQEENNNETTESTNEVLNVYPNPTNGQITITIENFDVENESHKIILYNSLGKQMQQINVTGEKTDVDLSSYENGIYLLSFSDGQETRVVRISKTN